jgi:two-component system, response regulator PdtaR
VEDEELLRLYAAGLLEEHGYRVVEADNAEIALQLLERRPDVRLVFTDVQMPGKWDGMDLVRQVHESLPHVLLLITSGPQRPSDAEIPAEGRILSKPYRPEDLLREVDGLFRD